MTVVALAVLSVDGCMTRGDEPGSGFASREDQEHFRSAMGRFQAVIMGRATFDVERERILSAPDRGPVRIVLTRSPSSFAGLERPGRLEFSDEAPDRLLAGLERRGVGTVGLLGGARIFDLFVESDLVSEWHITVEPLLLGAGTRLLTRETSRRLELVDRRELNSAGTMLLTYRRRG